jgi:hypothetical protein
MHCHLVVPDLFWPDREARDVYAGLATPALALIIARGRKVPSAVEGLDGWLARRFDLDPDAPLPAGPYRLDGDGGAPGDGGTWLCADPVHLRVDRDRLVLADAALLAVTPDESAAIVESLDRHFAPAGYRFVAPAPERWYLRSERPVDVAMTPLELARGRTLDAIFPEGPAGGKWRALVNEAQMLLHDHPVNARREAHGQPAINSIWPWGAGVWRTLKARVGGRWLADAPLPRGLARAASLPCGMLPQGFDAMIAEQPSEGVVHVVLEAPMQAVARGDRDAWQAAITAVETDWAAPALAALRARRIGMVSVHAPGAGHCLDVETAGGDLRYFWRRPRALASYVAPA